MADERASITISVTDEASGKIKEISDAFEQMRQKMQQATQATNENAKQQQEDHEKNKHHIGQQVAAYTSLGATIRQTVIEAVRGFNTLGLAMGPVTKSLGAAAEFGGLFARSLGLAGVAVGGLAAAGGAAVAAMGLLSRSFAEAERRAESFRRITNMRDQGMIERMQEARKLIGMTDEEASASIAKVQDLARDLIRGPASDLVRIANDMGQGWAKWANQLANDVTSGKKTITEARDALLDFLGTLENAEARRAARKFGIDPREIEFRKEIKRYESEIAEQSEKVLDAQKKVNEAVTDSQIAWKNLKTHIWDAIGPSTLNQLAAMEKVLGATLKLIDDIITKKDVFQGEGGAATRGYLEGGVPMDFPAPKSGEGGDFWDWILGTGRFKKGGQQGTPQRFGAFGGADLSGLGINEKNWNNMINDPTLIQMGGRRIIDLRGQQQDNQTTGGQPVILDQMKESEREIADHSRESVDHLRTIRDIMEWLKQQTEQAKGDGARLATGGGGTMVDPRTGGTFGGPAGTGGTGFGGNLGGFAQGGGGQSRTGSPWFGGAAGRGTGGVPSMGQGGPGAGQDFYNQALAQVKSSGLVGKVPPDGGQFGITTGSAEEWARFMTGVAKAESNFNPRTSNLSDPGQSHGVLQYAHNQVPGGNAFDVGASINAFIRDAQQAVNSGGIRSPQSLLRRRFSTIGSHPERTIRNLVNYGDAGGVSAGGGQSTTISDRPGVTGGSVPHVAGTVQLGGQTFHWGSGGHGRGSIPFGTFPINPAWTGQGQLGDVGRRIGSIATIGGRGGEIQDPRIGLRAGIQIHRGSSDDLDRLYSAGCFAVAPSEWGRFKQTLMNEVARHPEGLFLTVNRNGQAFIGPRGQPPQAVGQVGRIPPDAPRGGQATQYRGLPIRDPQEQERQQFGGEFEPRDPSGMPLHRGVGGEAIGARSLRNVREALRREREADRRAAREGAPFGGAIPPGQTADEPGRGTREGAPLGGGRRRLSKDEASRYRDFTKRRIYDAHTNKTDEDEQHDLDRSLRRFRVRKGIFEEPLVDLHGKEIKRQEDEEDTRDEQIDPRTGRSTRKRAMEDVVDPKTGRTTRSTLDVNVSAPKGTSVKADKGDTFDNVKVKQHRQMDSPDEE